MADVSVLKTLHARIYKEVQEIKIDKKDFEDDTILTNYNKLLRFSQDIDRIRRQTHKNNDLNLFNKELHNTDRTIEDLLIAVEIQIEKLHQEKLRIDREKATNEEATNNSRINGSEIENIDNSNNTNYGGFQKESIETLKSRLLSTKHTELDQIQSTELQNNYHESIQQELIDSLPSMVSSIKEQALQFQQLIKQDAVILKEATQNFETSTGKFDNVNKLLSKYHKEGRLGFWFYIRIISMVIVSFLFLLIIIRLIPARH